MSRFSRSDAEKAGWVFTHKSDPVTLVEGGEQGVTRVVPARVTAEKFLSLPGRGDHTITETADSMGLLLERIHSFEEHLAHREDPSELAPDYSDEESLDVLLPEGDRVSDREWSDGTSETVAQARSKRAEQKQLLENARVVHETAVLDAGGDVKPEGGRIPTPEEEETDDLDSLSVKKLKKLARRRKISLRGISKKDDIVATIRGAK